MKPPPRLTITDAKDMPYAELLDAAYDLVNQYAVPEEPETMDARVDRLERSLDELPDIYAWLLQLESWFDHWADLYAAQFNQRSLEYKQMRERRDAMAKAASAAKLRYEGASRVLTKIMNFEVENRMPRSR